jgi:ATPase subunit of ABC transporter with duplicated ATPase domains
MVSHDRYFLDAVADHILAFGNREESGGRVEFYEGNYSEFQQRLARRKDPTEVSPEAAEIKLPISEPRDEKTATSAPKTLSKNRREMLERRITEIENRISEAEDDLARISAQLSEPSIATNQAAFNQLTAEYKTVEGEIDRLYEEWAEISGVLDEKC